MTNAGGTQALGDFPGKLPTLEPQPAGLTAIGKDVYFQLNSDTIGMSDGTVNGTVAISVPSSGGSVQAPIPGTTLSTFQTLTDWAGTRSSSSSR